MGRSFRFHPGGKDGLCVEIHSGELSIYEPSISGNPLNMFRLELTIPLWLILAMLGMPTAVLWWLDRARPRAADTGVSVWQAISRQQSVCIVVQSVMAEYCGVPPSSVHPNATMASLLRMRSDGADETEFIRALEARLEVHIDADWWEAELGGTAGAKLSFEHFARTLAGHIVSQTMTCACGYNLTGNSSGICPECGQPVHPPAPSP